MFDLFTPRPGWYFHKYPGTLPGRLLTVLVACLCIVYFVNRVLQLSQPEKTFLSADILSIFSDLGGFMYFLSVTTKGLMLILPNNLHSQLIQDVFETGRMPLFCRPRRMFNAYHKLAKQLDIARFVRKQM